MLTEKQIQENKERFISLLKQSERKGVDELIKYLEKTDAYIAPSSTRFHGNYAGGLIDHSLKVYDTFVKLVEVYKTNEPTFSPKPESLILIALLHDLCKVNLYVQSTRNVKDESTGVWKKVPVYKKQDNLCMGHSEGSIYFIMNFMRLSVEEALTIRWHMDGYDPMLKTGDSSAMSPALEKTPLITLFQMSDIYSSRLLEGIDKSAE